MSLGQSILAMEDDEVEKKMVEGGEVEGEVEICVEENWWKNVWRKMKAYWRS